VIHELRGTVEAESLIEDLGFTKLPINPEEVAKKISDDSFKLVVESHPFDSMNILGKALGNDKGALVYVNSNIPHGGRYNFTVAHELGHVCMHIMHGVKSEFECGKNELSNQYDDPREQEANGFASGLLMPKSLVSKLTDGDINWVNIQIVEKACETSLEASFRRMARIYRDPCALIIHKDGNFWRYILSDNFAAFVNKSPLSVEQKSLCINGLTEFFPADFDTVDAIDWVSPRIKHETLETIYSSSISLKNDITYTLLRYDDECFVDVND
jgi:Zn-dependent peptidase ImmA (M78 family)